MNEKEHLRRQKAVLDALKYYKGDAVYQLNKESKERKEKNIQNNISELDNKILKNKYKIENNKDEASKKD